MTRDKEYDITQGTPGSQILWFTVNHNGEAETVKIYYRQRPKLKKLIEEFDFSELLIKGRAARGNLVSKNAINKIQLKSKGVSTIGGKDIWFDEDIQRLNEDGRGLHLGQFNTGDHILAIFKDGTYYTTSFDMSNRYQGELLKIEKLDMGKTYTALYYDKSVSSFYVKRFSFDVSDNTPVSFISDSKGSYLVELSDDKHPQFEITFGGKDIWFDEDIQRLNEDGRGLHLGQFNTGDHILAIFKDGTYYTTSFDLSNRYQGDLLKIEKLDVNKTYTVLYYDKGVESFYVKRFSFDVSDNTPVSFISDSKGSYLVEISDDKHPQFETTFGGKHEHREAEVVDAEEFIAKKGLQAKGKKVSAMDVKSVKFIEPLHKPEDDVVPAEEEGTDHAGENQAGEIDNSDVEEVIDLNAADDDGQLSLF